jgi:hypothetical protein
MDTMKKLLRFFGWILFGSEYVGDKRQVATYAKMQAEGFDSFAYSGFLGKVIRYE